MAETQRRKRIIPKFHNPLGLLIAILYFASTVIGFFVIVPLGSGLRNFHGVCPLFAQLMVDFTYNFMVLWPWMPEVCNYTLFYTLGASVIYSFLMGLAILVGIWPRTEKHEHRVGLLQRYHGHYILYAMNPVFTFINSFLVLFQLASAALLTGGLAGLCRSLVDVMNQQGITLNTCVEAEHKVPWNKVVMLDGNDMGTYGYNFYTVYVMATVCSWVLVGIWVAQLVINCNICCPRCGWELPEEKVKDKKFIVAARRSRMATPIGTPGGHMTPSYPQGPSHGPLPPKF